MPRSHVLPLVGVLLALSSAPVWAARLTGAVSGPTGQPLANVRIVLDAATGPVSTTRTTPAGTFSLDAPAGDYVLRVVADGFDAPP